MSGTFDEHQVARVAGLAQRHRVDAAVFAGDDLVFGAVHQQHRAPAPAVGMVRGAGGPGGARGLAGSSSKAGDPSVAWTSRAVCPPELSPEMVIRSGSIPY